MEQREKLNIKNYINEFLKEINDTDALWFIYRYTEKVALRNGDFKYETREKINCSNEKATC